MIHLVHVIGVISNHSNTQYNVLTFFIMEWLCSDPEPGYIRDWYSTGIADQCHGVTLLNYHISARGFICDYWRYCEKEVVITDTANNILKLLN